MEGNLIICFIMRQEKQYESQGKCPDVGISEELKRKIEIYF